MGRTRKTANLVNELVGIDTTAKSTFTDIDFSGDIAGDGSELSGISAGLGTALSSDFTSPLSNIYYTNQVLEFDNTATVDVPSTAKVAYTQYAEIQVNGTADLIIADGDDLVTDILGIGTTGTSSGTLAGGGGRLRADNITGQQGVSAPTFPSGLVVGAAATFTSLSANAINSDSSLIVSGGLIVGSAATFNGNVNIAGVITYDDVTNIDSVGLITARSGINVTSAGINVADGINVSSGITTASGGLTAKKVLVEQVNNETAVNGEFNFYLDEGHLYYSNYNATGDYYPNFKINASTDLNTYMNNYETVTCTAIIGSNSTSVNFLNTIHIDGNAHGENSYNITTEWVGGSSPTAGAGSGYDVYNFTIIKRSDKNFHIFANTNTAN